MTSAFALAAWAFARLVREIPESAWTGPGLGDWDLRALVGHASRSLLTVSSYLKAPCEHRDIDSPAAYYAAIRQTLATGGSEIVERGRQAGRDLDAATTLAAQISVMLGDGATVVLALTGREDLPPSYSVV